MNTEADLPDPPNPLLINSQLVKTRKDYEEMKFEDILIYEKRSLCTYFYQFLLDDHLILTTYFNHSLILPRFIRIAKAVINICMEFALNALFFSDAYISKSYKEASV